MPPGVSEHVVALAVFASYFAVILLLFAVVLRSIPWQYSAGKGHHVMLYAGLALASLAHTWTYMIKFLLWSFRHYELLEDTTPNMSLLERLANWLVNTKLFEQAWFSVCEGRTNWLWSEQLCLFTVGAWTVFLYIESRGSRVSVPWAYMLLGQLVAISVASNLFFLALAVSPRIPAHERLSARRVPLFLGICVAVGLATVYRSPAVLHSHFLPNLLLMHAAITFPLLPLPDALERFGKVPVTGVYWFITCAALAIRGRTLNSTLSSGVIWRSIPLDAWETLHSHPAQSSIGWDIVWTTASFLVYEILELGGLNWASIAVPLVSIGVTAPNSLAHAEAHSRTSQKAAAKRA